MGEKGKLSFISSTPGLRRDDNTGVSTSNTCVLPVEVTKALSHLPGIQQELSNINGRLNQYELAFQNINKINEDIYGVEGLDDKLKYVGQQSAENTLDVTDIKCENIELKKEIDLLKSVVIRLDRKVSEQEKEILDLKGRSMRDNILIHGFKENQGGDHGENLEQAVCNVLENELGVKDVKFVRIHRNGQNPNIYGKPRSITGRLVDRNKKDEILKAQKAKKDSGVQLSFYVTPQNPPKLVEARKQLLEINSKYQSEGVKSKVVGDRLIFPGGNVYKQKVPVPRAEDILCCDKNEEESLDQINVATSSEVQEGGNIFVANGSEVKTYNQVRNVYKKICKNPKNAKATHNILVYRFKDSNGKIHEGYEDDGEYGAGRRLLKYMTHNGLCDMCFIVTIWFSGKHIGMKRFEIMEGLVNETAGKI